MTSYIKQNLDFCLNYNLFMWDFKLKKTRLILLVSILWSLVGYLLASNSVFSFIVYNQKIDMRILKIHISIFG